MTLPLILSMVLMGTTVLVPPKTGAKGTNITTSSNTSTLTTISDRIVLHFGGNQFVAGVAVGLGLAWVAVSELKRTRLHDRLRLAIRGLLRDAMSSSPTDDPAVSAKPFKLLLPPSSPVAPSTSAPTAQQSMADPSLPPDNPLPDAIRAIVSPATNMTSDLFVSTIRIPPNHELKYHRASGLELYYVLQGSGHWGDEPAGGKEQNQPGEQLKGSPFQKGDAFVVDPNRPRWIVNTALSEDLILLRSTDYENSQRCDSVVRSITKSSMPGDFVSSGLQSMASMMKSLRW